MTWLNHQWGITQTKWNRAQMRTNKNVSGFMLFQIIFNVGQIIAIVALAWMVAS